LAEQNPDHAGTLSACAVILLATALEQAVKTRLSEASISAAVEQEIEAYSETIAAEFDDASIWWRVQSLPSVLSERRFRLAHNHELARALRRMIKVRNKLVHVDEPAIHLTTPNDQIQVEANQVTVTFRQPVSPWGSVNLDQARTFEKAVEAYFAEVLFPESGEITAGPIVIQRL
jgi:hypothetical protein